MSDTIIIVDDQESDRLILERLLREQGIRNPVMTFNDGEEVVRYLRAKVCSDREVFPFPFVIFLDLKMPNMGGMQVLEALRGLSSRKPLVIIYTSVTDIKVIRDAYSVGGDALLSKPPKGEDLLDLIQHFPGRWQRPTPSRRRNVQPSEFFTSTLRADTSSVKAESRTTTKS
jgi:CheY-like chemotaxis protein